MNGALQEGEGRNGGGRGLTQPAELVDEVQAVGGAADQAPLLLAFAVEGQERGRTAEDYIPTFSGPSREVDKSWWPQSDAAQSTKLRDGIRSLVERSLDVTMPRILSGE